MLAIRLQRIGKRNDPKFRVIVTESSRGPKSGDYIELLGSADPKSKTRQLNKERILHWISKGAQPSVTVHNMLISEGVLSGATRNPLPKKRPIAVASDTAPEESGGKAEPSPEEASADQAPPEAASETSEDTAQSDGKEKGAPEKGEQA